MSAPPPCALEALGVVNALGSGWRDVLPRLIDGDTTRLVRRSDLAPGRELLVGAVREPLPEIPSSLAAFDSRNDRLALAALEQIDDEVRGAIRRVGAERFGVVIGTSTSGVGRAEAALRHRERAGILEPGFDYAQLEFGSPAVFLARHLGARGPAYAISTACSSSARALAAARSLLRLGLCDAVLAGGADELCGYTAGGFAALQALCDGPSNPLGADRRGLNLGEGAALFLVTQRPGGVQLSGVGESCEAHHMSAPDPSGAGAEAAMLGALCDAGAAAERVVYVNLHGTGTPQNDAMESRAVARVLGCDVPCSSTKPLVGHTLGAAGAMEAAFCWMVLRAADEEGAGEIALPPHGFAGALDPELPPLRLAAKGERVAAGPGALVLSNSFGFGGNNCALALARGGA
jgi:3-oxoacyl-[acyl-carrier-protein] synthase-1